MSPDERPARDRTRAERRVVRRAVRRGRHAQVPAGLAPAVLEGARRRQRRSRRLLVGAVLGILASAGGAGALALTAGATPLLAAPAAVLLVAGLAGLRSESRLRRAEEAEALAAHEVRRAAERPAPESGAAPGSGAAFQGAAQQRLARVMSGTRVVGPRDPTTSRHPWE